MCLTTKCQPYLLTMLIYVHACFAIYLLFPFTIAINSLEGSSVFWISGLLKRRMPRIMGMLKFLLVRQMQKDCWIAAINSLSRITVSFELQLSILSLKALHLRMLFVFVCSGQLRLDIRIHYFNVIHFSFWKLLVVGPW